MRTMKAIPLALALLLAAAPGVFASALQTQNQSTPQNKPNQPKSGSTSHSKKSPRKSSSKPRGRERAQKAPTPERITEIQQALAKNGAYTKNPNGKWDDSTVDAMKRFQESHGLNPTGKLDARTLQQLGLGSSTAGVAAPTPPVSSSAVKPAPPAPAQN